MTPFVWSWIYRTQIHKTIYGKFNITRTCKPHSLYCSQHTPDIPHWTLIPLYYVNTGDYLIHPSAAINATICSHCIKASLRTQSEPVGRDTHSGRIVYIEYGQLRANACLCIYIELPYFLITVRLYLLKLILQPVLYNSHLPAKHPHCRTLHI